MKNIFLRYLAMITASVALLTPMSAVAYLSPEQVFGGQSIAPPLPREGEQVQKAQQQRSAEIRSSAQAELRPEIGLEPVDTYVPPDTKKPSMLDNANAYDLRMQRIAEKNEASSPTIIIGGQGTVIDSNGNVLHSGAPIVSETGPTTTLAFIAVALSVLSTFLYVKIQSRRMAQA